MKYYFQEQYSKEETQIDYFTSHKHNQKCNRAEDDSKPKGKKPRKEDFNEQRSRKRGLD